MVAARSIDYGLTLPFGGWNFASPIMLAGACANGRSMQPKLLRC